METDKYRLAFKKIFDQKKAKDKYQGKEQDAAKKALEKVKRMKGAANYNMFVYNNKGEVKGIKVFLKKDKKMKPEDEKGVDVLTPPTPATPTRSTTKAKPRPKKEEEMEEEMEEKKEEKKEEENEEMEYCSIVPNLYYMRKLCDFLSGRYNDDSEEEEEEEESSSSSEEEEEKTEEEEKQPLKTPKTPKTPKPVKKETKPLHGRQAPAPMMTPKPTHSPEPLEAPPAPKVTSKSAPSLSTPTATPKTPRVKQVAPKPPRKIPQGLTQKYETASVTFDLSVAPPTTPTAKRVKDYRNNPEDRRNAYTKMCMNM